MDFTYLALFCIGIAVIQGQNVDRTKSDPTTSQNRDDSTLQPTYQRSTAVNGQQKSSEDLTSPPPETFVNNQQKTAMPSTADRSSPPPQVPPEPGLNIDLSRATQTTDRTRQGVYDCPTECRYCRTFSTACRAFSEVGDILPSFYDTLSVTLMSAYEETRGLNLFYPNAQVVTCKGLTDALTLWNDLSDSVKQTIQGFLADSANTSSEVMRTFPKEIYTSLQPDLERKIYQELTPEQKEVICADLKYENCLVRSAIRRKLDCYSILMAFGDDVSAIVDMTGYSNWNNTEWSNNLAHLATGMSDKHFQNVPIDVLLTRMPDLMDKCQGLSKDIVKVIAKRTKAKLLELKASSAIPPDTKAAWMNFLSHCGASPDFLDDVLDFQEIITNVDMSKADPREAMKYMEKQKSALNPRNLVNDQIVNSIKILAVNKSLMMELDDTQLQLAACDICRKASDLEPSDMRKIAKVLRLKLPSFTDPTSFDASKVECISCMMPYFGRRYFNQISGDAMRQALTSGNIKNMTLPRSQGRSLVATARTAFNRPNGRFTSEEMKSMGSTALAFTSRELANISDASFDEDVVNSLVRAMEDEDTTASISRAVKGMFVEKMKNGVGIEKVLETSLASSMPMSYLEEADFSDFTDLAGDTSEMQITCNSKQARFVMKKIKSRIGPVSSDNHNYTLKRISNIVPCACGFMETDIDNFNKDSAYPDILDKIGKSPCLTRGLAKKLFKEQNLFTSFDTMDAATIQASTTSATISQMSPQLLVQNRKVDLDKYGSTLCQDILEKIATAETVQLLTKAELQDKWDFFKSCVIRTGTIITADDLKKIGNLMCGITSTFIEMLDADAMDQNLDVIQLCPLTNEERQTLTTNYLSKMGITHGSDMTPYVMATLGTLLMNVPVNIMDGVDDAALSDVSENVMTRIKNKEESDAKRAKAGFKQDFSDSDKEIYHGKKIAFLKRVIAAKISERALSGDSARRKRSVVSLTCSDLQSLGTTGLSALTTTQISNLDDQEFIDCAETLGSVTDYSDDQESALLAVATRATVWGDPSTWTSTDIYSAGVICQAMSVAQIDTLDLDLDTISRFGQFDGWEKPKKKAVYDRWLSLQKGGDSSTITSSELRSLGHVTCGADTSHISAIPSSVYQSASDAVGEVTCCEASQLQAFVTLAKTAYGSDVSTWDTTVVSNVGTVIGGLSAVEISSLTEAQINVLDPNLISYIPDATFTGFTVDQINTFSVSQAQATTSSQREALSTSQLEALSTVADITWSRDSGAITRTSWIMLLLPLVISVF